MIIWQLIILFLAPLLMNWQKGEEIFEFMYAYKACLYLVYAYIVYWLFPNPFWCMTKKGRSIGGFMIWFHVLYIFISYMFFIYSCFILYLIIEHHLRGSFYLSSISCIIAYMFCHHQKRGDCWPKRLHSPFV